MIAIVDYGMGNVRSLRNALEYIGHDVDVTDDIDELQAADRIVLPGVGAFGDAMAALQQKRLIGPLTDIARCGVKPILGVCLGMQLFAQSSTEHGEHQGLGWVQAHVRRLEPGQGLKVPHVGWNDLSIRRDEWLFTGIKPLEGNFYFVHSFHMVSDDPELVIATSDYGGPVTAVIRKGNLVAAQFHPEKSQDNGIRFLQNWTDWTPEC